VCGNSLLGVEKDLLNYNLFAELEDLKPRYFNATQPAQKQALKQQIDSLIDQLTNGRRQFDFEIYFSEVFHQKGGFDVVIGNPPYVDGRRVKDNELKIYKKLFKSAEGKVNFFNLFIEKGLTVLRNGAFNCFIVPAPILRNSRYRSVRNLILNQAQIGFIVLFNKMQFDAAVVESVVLGLVKQSLPSQNGEIKVFYDLSTIPQNIIEQSRFKTIHDNRFLVTVTTDDLRILDKIREKSVPLKEICQVRDGISTGFMPFPDILLGKKEGNYFVSNKGTKERFDKNIHKKIIDGGEFNKFSPILWEQRYIKYDKQIEQNPKPSKGKPFNCQLREREIFETQAKLVSRQTSNRLIATLDTEQYFTRNSIHNISVINSKYDIKYVLGLFNSKLLNFVYQKLTEEIGTVLPQVHIADLNELPIREADIKMQEPIIKLVDRILAAKAKDPQADTSALEREIDRLVYALYGLTEDEIRIVEGGS
jgi:hypothetical protein